MINILVFCIFVYEYQIKHIMSIQYEFYRNPNSEGTNKKRYHARVVGYNRVSPKRLVEEVRKKCGFSEGVVENVLINLADQLTEHLVEGNKVHIEGIGYFQVNLRCKEEIRRIHGARSENIEIKSVSFRADHSLKKNLMETKIRRSRIKPHSCSHTEESIDKLLAKHFETNQTLTRHQFQYLSGLLKATACRFIKKLVEAGKLKNVATNRNPVYVPSEGHYGN